MRLQVWNNFKTETCSRPETDTFLDATKVVVIETFLSVSLISATYSVECVSGHYCLKAMLKEEFTIKTIFCKFGIPENLTWCMKNFQCELYKLLVYLDSISSKWFLCSNICVSGNLCFCLIFTETLVFFSFSALVLSQYFDYLF